MEGSEDAYVGYMTIKVRAEPDPEELAVYQRSFLLVPSQGSTGELCNHSGKVQANLQLNLFIAEDKIISTLVA